MVIKISSVVQAVGQFDSELAYQIKRHGLTRDDVEEVFPRTSDTRVFRLKTSDGAE